MLEGKWATNVTEWRMRARGGEMSWLLWDCLCGYWWDANGGDLTVIGPVWLNYHRQKVRRSPTACSKIYYILYIKYKMRNLWSHCMTEFIFLVMHSSVYAWAEDPIEFTFRDAQFLVYTKNWTVYVTRAGKMSRNAQSLILSYRQKKWKMSVLVEFEVLTKKEFIKPSSSDPSAPNSN